MAFAPPPPNDGHTVTGTITVTNRLGSPVTVYLSYDRFVGGQLEGVAQLFGSGVLVESGEQVLLDVNVPNSRLQRLSLTALWGTAEGAASTPAWATSVAPGEEVVMRYSNGWTVAASVIGGLFSLFMTVIVAWAAIAVIRKFGLFRLSGPASTHAAHHKSSRHAGHLGSGGRSSMTSDG